MSRSPIILPPALAPLAVEKRWMVWKWITGKNGKLTKPPFRADRPRQHASSTDPSTWCDLPTAMRAYTGEQCDGIGVALVNFNLGAFDLDDCRDATTGALHPWALDKIERSGSYAEVTPSNTGVRIIGLAAGAIVHRKFAVPQANGVSVELYRKAERYITITGQQIGGAAALANINSLLDQTLAELDGEGKAPKPKPKLKELKPDQSQPKKKHNLDKLIKDGCGQDFGGDRSRAVWYVINQLLSRGRAADDVVKILLDRANGISAHIYDQPDPAQFARKQVEKAQAADPRATITLGVGATERTVNELERLLIASDRGLYQRGGFIVSTGFTSMKTWDKQTPACKSSKSVAIMRMLEDAGGRRQFRRSWRRRQAAREVTPPNMLVFTLKDRKTGCASRFSPRSSIAHRSRRRASCSIGRATIRRPASCSTRSASPFPACQIFRPAWLRLR